jgi:hypothetical protein
LLYWPSDKEDNTVSPSDFIGESITILHQKLRHGRGFARTDVVIRGSRLCRSACQVPPPLPPCYILVFFILNIFFICRRFYVAKASLKRQKKKGQRGAVGVNYTAGAQAPVCDHRNPLLCCFSFLLRTYSYTMYRERNKTLHHLYELCTQQSLGVWNLYV